MNGKNLYEITADLLKSMYEHNSEITRANGNNQISSDKVISSEQVANDYETVFEAVSKAYKGS